MGASLIASSSYPKRKGPLKTERVEKRKNKHSFSVINKVKAYGHYQECHKTRHKEYEESMFRQRDASFEDQVL